MPDTASIIDVPGGWATIIVAIVSFVLGPLVTAVIAARTSHRVKALKADSVATRSQVENSHDTNMRAENDERHNELIKLVSTVIETQKTQGRDIGGLREDIRGIRSDHSALAQQLATERDRIHKLETTRPRTSTRKGATT